MYEVKIKLKLSKKEKKRLEEVILLKLSKQDLLVEPEANDKVQLSYVSNDISYSTAIDLVSEVFVRNAFFNVFGEDVLNSDKNKIEEVTIRETKKDANSFYSDIIDKQGGVINIKCGTITFSKNIQF